VSLVGRPNKKHGKKHREKTGNHGDKAEKQRENPGEIQKIAWI